MLFLHSVHKKFFFFVLMEIRSKKSSMAWGVRVTLSPGGLVLSVPLLPGPASLPRRASGPYPPVVSHGFGLDKSNVRDQGGHIKFPE